MLKAALVGGAIVFAANMIADTDYIKAKVATDPNSFLWKHANVAAGVVIGAVAHKLGMF